MCIYLLQWPPVEATSCEYQMASAKYYAKYIPPAVYTVLRGIYYEYMCSNVRAWTCPCVGTKYTDTWTSMHADVCGACVRRHGMSNTAFIFLGRSSTMLSHAHAEACRVGLCNAVESFAQYMYVCIYIYIYIYIHIYIYRERERDTYIHIIL